MEQGPGEYVVREYQPGDEQAILAGSNRAFAAVDRAFQPRSLDEWRWRFLENPGGWRIWLVLTRAGEVVAQLAGMPITMLHKGERVRWNQIVDSFGAPGRGGGLKPSVVLLAARAFHDACGGLPPEKEPCMYGLPSRRAYRIGQRLFGYQTVRNQNEVRIDPERMIEGSAGSVDVEEVRAFPPEVDAFFERARGPFGAIAVRDRAFLDWRFARRPGIRYRIALARLHASRELLGYAVFRKATFDGLESGLIVDWLVDPEQHGAGHALRRWLRTCAREADTSLLRGIFPEPGADFREFQRAGFRVHPTSYNLAAGSSLKGFHTLRLYWDWHYTFAEFDVV